MPLPSYSIDFNNLVKQLLGAFDRRPIRVAWLTAMAAGLKSIHQKWLAFSDAKLDDVKYNGQTFVLEQFLIARFGPGIFITNNNGGTLDGLFVGDGLDFQSTVGDGGDLDSYVDTSYDVTPYDFTVNVPSALVFELSQMEAYIRRYKMFGTTFNIVIF